LTSKYSDVQNLNWNDIIKINEQYFIVDKINEFNLTNRELTKVDLIQYNVNPQEYPTRYFKYQYCDAPGYCFKLKTDFTNENLLDTNFIFSLYYDNQVGSLTTQTSGFTAAFRLFNPISFREEWIPYTMNEITQTEYETGGCYDSSCDTLLTYFYNTPNLLQYSLTGFWDAGGTTTGSTGVNVWQSCSDFYTTATTYGIVTGSSTTYGLFSTNSFNGIIHFKASLAGAIGQVREVQLTSNGDIFVGGSFAYYNDVALNTNANLVKLNSDGVYDTTFSHVTLGLVNSIEIDSNNKILVGSLGELYRLNADGSIDTTFNGGT